MDSTAAVLQALKETQMQCSYLYVPGLGQVVPPKSKLNGPKTLHLVLKSKWFDKIASGEKTSEYRVCKPYWNKRLSYLCRDGAHGADDYARYGNYDGWNFTPYCEYSRVCFHRGYTNQTMVFEINKVLITTEPNDLGLDKCWEIKLGQRITKGDDNVSK